jgi:hypothetical protein
MAAEGPPPPDTPLLSHFAAPKTASFEAPAPCGCRAAAARPARLPGRSAHITNPSGHMRARSLLRAPEHDEQKLAGSSSPPQRQGDPEIAPRHRRGPNRHLQRRIHALLRAALRICQGRAARRPGARAQPHSMHPGGMAPALAAGAARAAALPQVQHYVVWPAAAAAFIGRSRWIAARAPGPGPPRRQSPCAPARHASVLHAKRAQQARAPGARPTTRARPGWPRFAAGPPLQEHTLLGTGSRSLSARTTARAQACKRARAQAQARAPSVGRPCVARAQAARRSGQIRGRRERGRTAGPR